ncbi:endophilin-a [Anaeramoeba flamelloides]|uniref:Endophilin-a n=1 Tax=Anaeramoeba flamelloides TaxID=1746091 RepID=A0ABQ8XUE5_9EUKA|nr:endophilin-a [Anaeramoeba flamelloides]
MSKQKKKKQAFKKYKNIAKALYDYQTEETEMLNFNSGDRIKIISRNSDGWWEGSLDSQKGFFPSNYVQDLTLPKAPPSVIAKDILTEVSEALRKKIKAQQSMIKSKFRQSFENNQPFFDDHFYQAIELRNTLEEKIKLPNMDLSEYLVQIRTTLTSHPYTHEIMIKKEKLIDTILKKKAAISKRLLETIESRKVELKLIEGTQNQEKQKPKKRTRRASLKKSQQQIDQIRNKSKLLQQSSLENQEFEFSGTDTESITSESEDESEDDPNIPKPPLPPPTEEYFDNDFNRDIFFEGESGIPKPPPKKK